MGDKQRRDYGSGSISQRKDGTWTARMIIGTNEAGNPRIKAFYGKSEREVKKKMKEFEKELHKNDGTVVQKNTVETYMRNWLYSVKSNELKPKSFDRLEQTIVYQVIPHIGNLQIAAIQADDVQKMLNTLKAEGKSYSTIKKAYDAVNECFRTGMIKRTVTGNPALGVAVPAKKTFTKSKIKCYTKEESERLCEAATRCYKNGKMIYRLGNAIPLALNTGLRLAELVGLKWEDVSLEDRILTVSETRVVVKDRSGKSGNKYITIEQDSAKSESSERTLYLNDEALAALSQLHDITGGFKYVLSTEDGGALSPRYLDRMLRKIAVLQYAFMICSEKAHYKSGIYCSDLDTKNLVENHIKSLCESYSDDVLRIVFRRSDSYIIFKNGSILKVLSASDNSRGQRFNLVIFDKEINKTILDHIIRPFDMGDRLEYCLYHDKKETEEEK